MQRTGGRFGRREFALKRAMDKSITLHIGLERGSRKALLTFESWHDDSSVASSMHVRTTTPSLIRLWTTWTGDEGLRHRAYGPIGSSRPCAACSGSRR
jgi:hypothetical protein